MAGEHLVAVVNPDGSLVGSGGGGGSVTVTNFPATQPVSGTVTSNAGTGPSVANSWNVRITDGVDIAAVTTSGLGNALLVTNGMLTAGKTLSAVAVNTTGTTVDLGAARSNMTAVLVTTGTLTGTATLELSLDSITWVSSTVTVNITTAGNLAMYSIGRPARYVRVSLTAQAGTGTLTADVTGA